MRTTQTIRRELTSLQQMAALTDRDIQQRMKDAPAWQRDGEQSIERQWAFPDFAAAIAFVNRVAELAEQADHHPDIRVHGWNKVTLTLSTHSAGGLTDADFALAALLDALAP